MVFLKGWTTPISVSVPSMQNPIAGENGQQRPLLAAERKKGVLRVLPALFLQADREASGITPPAQVQRALLPRQALRTHFTRWVN